LSSACGEATIQTESIVAHPHNDSLSYVKPQRPGARAGGAQGFSLYPTTAIYPLVFPGLRAFRVRCVLIVCTFVLATSAYPASKHKHWCGFPADCGSKGAPMLAFDFAMQG
jgi:hypothetical protein